MKTYIIDINMPGIEICNDINFTTLLDFWPSRISDFGDAVVASLWADNRHASIATFDKRFLRELNRIGAQVYANHP